ncbi:hypothetical protein PRIPAC_78757 [Pristionchus pacificus]|uniref:Uncharacterized protein n=1 Tax=Pristionchus pacificus TaxID=54126 RepID=A0A2A6C4A4_PRIPA|nr:hypothetical protein PRIPAC_78757 [Pristionchus pacificus]|eukprot:PDM72956.1 hypothetical protein PRIPAC_39390 [Pristionchus pacificus]
MPCKIRLKLLSKLPSTKAKADADIGVNDCLSREAKIILELLEVLSVSDFSLKADNFDYRSLYYFFNKETLELPNEWLSELPFILELVNDALMRFPELRGINFSSGVNPEA